jgi:deoxycytidylate deaminase
MNALGHLNKRNALNLVLYTTIFPCHTCAKNLLPYGIERVVYKKDYDGREFDNTLKMFEKSNVTVSRLDLSLKRFLDIIFGRPAKKFGIWSSEELDNFKIVE